MGIKDIFTIVGLATVIYQSVDLIFTMIKHKVVINHLNEVKDVLEHEIVEEWYKINGGENE